MYLWCCAGPARLGDFCQFADRSVVGACCLRPVLIGFWARHEAQSDKLRAVLKFRRLAAQQRGTFVLAAHLEIDAILAGVFVVLAARNFGLRALVKVAEKLEMQKCRQNRCEAYLAEVV